MGISIKGMPIVADSFTITVSLILLRYTVVRTAVFSRVPRFGFCRRYPTLSDWNSGLGDSTVLRENRGV